MSMSFMWWNNIYFLVLPIKFWQTTQADAIRYIQAKFCRWQVSFNLAFQSIILLHALPFAVIYSFIMQCLVWLKKVDAVILCMTMLPSFCNIAMSQSDNNQSKMLGDDVLQHKYSMVN